jgi:hypothetical protein
VDAAVSTAGECLWKTSGTTAPGPGIADVDGMPQRFVSPFHALPALTAALPEQRGDRRQSPLRTSHPQ